MLHQMELQTTKDSHIRARFNLTDSISNLNQRKRSVRAALHHRGMQSAHACMMEAVARPTPIPDTHMAADLLLLGVLDNLEKGFATDVDGRAPLHHDQRENVMACKRYGLTTGDIFALGETPL